MKRYSIRKFVIAKNLKEAIKLEKETEINDIVVDEDFDEDYIEDETVVGFHG